MGFDRDTRSFADQQLPAQPALEKPRPDIRADLERLLSVDMLELSRAPKRFGLTAEQISEVQKCIARL